MKNTVKKYLIPNEDNDFKPHLLRRAGVAVLAVLTLGLFGFGLFQNFLFNHTNFLSAVLPPVLVDLANADRVERAIATLAVNPLLTQAAQEKANDMATRGYFAHNTPDGKTPWYWFSKVGYSYSSAGENLAINFTDSGEVNTAWMNSPEHRANILNGKFTEIGIATAQGMYQGRPTVFVVQEFGKPYIVKNGSAFVKTTVKPATVAKTSTSTQTAVTTTASSSSATASTTVLGATIAEEPKVLSQTQTFISIDNPDTADQPLAVSDAGNQATAVERLATEPRKTIAMGYVVLAGLVILALALLVGVELQRQHPRNVFAGLALLLFIIVLMYIYQQMTGTVLVL